MIYAKGTRANPRICREVMRMRKRENKGDCMEGKLMKKPKVRRVMYYCPECEAPMNCRYYWLCVDYLNDHKDIIYGKLVAM